jgi:hypothetical protein
MFIYEEALPAERYFSHYPLDLDPVPIYAIYAFVQKAGSAAT